MKQGQEINTEYGLGRIVQVFKERHSIDGRLIQSAGMQVELLTEEGKSAYRYDRGGILPYYFLEFKKK